MKTYRINLITDCASNINFKRGRICGIYDKCFNIAADGGLITIFKNTDFISSRALVSDFNGSFLKLDIANGEKVFCENNIIKLKNILFDKENAEIFAMKKTAGEIAAFYKPQMCKDEIVNFLKSSEKVGLNAYFDEIMQFCENGAISGSDEYIKKILTAFKMLFNCEYNAAFNRLIGLGIGLTPSCDDVLSGIAALTYLADKNDIFCTFLKKYLENFGEKRTTYVSARLLSDVASGYINQNIFDVITLNSTDKNLRKCAAYGSSSGLETLIGIVMGIYFLKRRRIIDVC